MVNKLTAAMVHKAPDPTCNTKSLTDCHIAVGHSGLDQPDLTLHSKCSPCYLPPTRPCSDGEQHPRDRAAPCAGVHSEDTQSWEAAGGSQVISSPLNTALSFNASPVFPGNVKIHWDVLVL